MSEVNTSYNFYGTESTTATSGTRGVSYTSQSNSDLDINDFMKLFCAELTHQDIMSGGSDSSGGSSSNYIAQLAQFTTLQSMKTLTEIIYAQYGSSMVGKTVKLESYDAIGSLTQETGKVESVTFMNGECTIKVNGCYYALSAVTQVIADGENSSENKTE